MRARGGPPRTEPTVSHWNLVTIHAGHRRLHEVRGRPLPSVSDLIDIDDDAWIVESVDRTARRGQPLVVARAVRYRLTYRYPSGERDGGHFTDTAGSRPDVGYRFRHEGAEWKVVERRVDHDLGGEPYVELVAEQRRVSRR